uniref:Uncharacterized protein n=1 Tax=Porcine serum-associated circular virus TaxID=1891204 RepID=A0A160G5G1_9VIRU|nr:hypothetical protein [Porcine serum-associated circular virus]
MGWSNISKTDSVESKSNIIIKVSFKDTSKLKVPFARLRRNFTAISVSFKQSTKFLSPLIFITYSVRVEHITIDPDCRIYPFTSHSITHGEGGSLLRYRVLVRLPYSFITLYYILTFDF